jgi:hypothetical protein
MKKTDIKTCHRNICKICVVFDYEYKQKILVKEWHATEVIIAYFQIQSWHFSENIYINVRKAGTQTRFEAGIFYTHN